MSTHTPLQNPIERRRSFPLPTPRTYRRFAAESMLSIERVLGRSRYAERAGVFNNAEMVVWQSTRRFWLAGAVAAGGILLHLIGWARGPMWPIFVVAPAYVTFVALLTVLIEGREKVTRVALIVLALADVAAIYATAFLVATPEYYGRALLLSLLALQLMQMFFLRSPALTVVAASSAAYLGLLVGADRRGIFIDWHEQSWMLCVFLIVSVHGMILQASANQRLAALVDLFAAAQRGDFGRTFVESRNREPDAITVLGRAYNHMRSELAEIAFTDNLTSCLNRNGFEYALDQMIDSATRTEEEVAILAVDIDHFKAINDTAGHLVGDMVLREVAMLLLDASRAGDVVGRVGGEEFVMLLPGADAETAGVVAERLMDSIRSHTFRISQGRKKVTISVGIASERISEPHIAGALRARADEALYVAKRLGRDRVVLWAPGMRSNATPPYARRVSAFG
jgi:diguanylate cyclase (GGDEF)-like protein